MSYLMRNLGSDIQNNLTTSFDRGIYPHVQNYVTEALYGRKRLSMAEIDILAKRIIGILSELLKQHDVDKETINGILKAVLSEYIEAKVDNMFETNLVNQKRMRQKRMGHESERFTLSRGLLGELT